MKEKRNYFSAQDPKFVNKHSPFLSVNNTFFSENVPKKFMGNKGRILVRKSGTEPKIRIMVESHNKSLISKCIKVIKKSIKNWNQNLKF